ncbi:MAG: hypothetical protein Q7T12_00490 [Flavobacterium sp.]|nr:hypothetical protein [Flavobacterium sp.]
MTEKYNSYLNRYEYFDSSGNLTGYKTYNSYLGVWEYFKENTNTYNKNPIQYAKPSTDDNFALLQQVANQKQNLYNNNHKRVQTELSIYLDVINNPEVEMTPERRTRIRSRYKLEVINFINNNRYDYSNTSVTNQVRDFIAKKFEEIISSE